MGTNYQISLFDLEQRDKGNQRYVRRITYDDTKPFLLGVHYARRMPCITDAFGLFVDGELIGVVTYGIPASPSLCIGLAGEKNKDNVLELNRLVMLPDKNQKNNASFLVSHSLKMLEYIYIYIYIVSYADYGGWGHIGYVYQATNFLYTGMTKARTDLKPISGGHSRHYIKGSLERVERTAKHRYIYLVGDKRKRKEMLKELRYPIIKEYPKGESIHYNTDNPVPIRPIEIIDGE